MISFHIIAILANCLTLFLCFYFHRSIKKYCKELNREYVDGNLNTGAYFFHFIDISLQIYFLVKYISSNEERFTGPLILCISLFIITNLYIHTELLNNTLTDELREKYDYIINPPEIGWENITMNELYKIADLSQPLEVQSSDKYTNITYRRIKND